MARYFRWVKKVGWVGSWYGLVWFGQDSEAEFKINGLFGPNSKAESEQ